MTKACSSNNKHAKLITNMQILNFTQGMLFLFSEHMYTGTVDRFDTVCVQKLAVSEK